MVANNYNEQFKLLMSHNPVVIFPEVELSAWDRLPRFTVLDADLKSLQQLGPKAKIERKRKSVKSSFVGSPIRTPDQGGVLKKSSEQSSHKRRSDDEETTEVQPRQKAPTSDANCKDSIELYAYMNHIAMSRIKNKVQASNSVFLNKTQLTKAKFTRDSDNIERERQLNTMLDQIRSKSPVPSI